MKPSLGLSASKTLRRSFSATNLFLRKQLWVWPLLAAMALAAIGYGLRTRVENSIKESMAAQLTAILDTDVEAMRIWLDVQRKNAETAAGAERVVELSRRVLALSERPGAGAADLLAAPELAELRTALKPWTKAHGYTDFMLVDRKQRIAGGTFDELIGQQAAPRYAAFLTRLLAGNSGVSRPSPSMATLKDAEGQLRAGVPTMFAAAPVRGADDRVIGVLGFRLRPDADFTQILNVAKFGQSGETYAFDDSGLMLSRSRFDDDLKRLGLIPDRGDASSVLTLELKDPLSDLTQGKPAKKRRSELGLTRMAADAVQGRSGVDAEGYRDYRGVPVIGAWKWLPDYGFGVATEIDVAEAYRPSQILRIAFWGLFALLAISAVAIFAFTLVVARLRHSMRHAALAAKQLGQYTLEEQIGQGGMGSVYRGRHAMLRRPTAIKLLDVDKTTPETIRRFEREVQLTSQLQHPNTIAVFDFGHTPEGVFYYAMEFLDGINLERLVQLYGPQSEGRVIQILLQVCGSLNEAHGIGLIHRDIKPANIVLSERGGQYDVVKLLDFGLVKAAHAENQLALTVANSITGTPLYLSPEAIEHPEDVDAKSDLYAVGAVGYYLLTGTTVFSGKSLVEVCMHQVNTPAEPPSQRLGRAVSIELETVLLKCLAKNPADRPASAKELAAALRACPMADAWSDADAENWWRGYSESTPQVSASPTTETAKQGATAVWSKES
ncbi:MAG TPA: serine/threonine protein kinase [Pirellulales bacterium]|nr:serine/threonine protein kinase [Pirellulales bacterium]